MSNPEKMRRVERALLAETSVSKSACARMLKALHEEGALNIDMPAPGSERTVRRRLESASSDAARRVTPLGVISNSMTLPGADFEWCYLDPAPLIFALTEDSLGFRKVMNDVVDSLGISDSLKIVLFVDECRPGNVLRPDQGRAVQHIMWTFADFPDWLSSRDVGWMTFGCVRTRIVDDMPGGMSALMKLVLHAFDGFATFGGLLAGDSHRIYRARVVAILGDEKGVKEAYASKGPGGTRPCLHCKNVTQFLDLAPDDYLIPISCSDRRRFDLSNDNDVSRQWTDRPALPIPALRLGWKPQNKNMALTSTRMACCGIDP